MAIWGIGLHISIWGYNKRMQKNIYKERNSGEYSLLPWTETSHIKLLKNSNPQIIRRIPEIFVYSCLPKWTPEMFVCSYSCSMIQWRPEIFIKQFIQWRPEIFIKQFIRMKTRNLRSLPQSMTIDKFKLNSKHQE